MPAGFPTDFPVYPKARLVAAAEFASSSQVVWGMEWESLDAEAKVKGFFSTQLRAGDWVVTVGSASSGRFVATFARKSNQSSRGTIAVNADLPPTRILVSLAAPA